MEKLKAILLLLGYILKLAAAAKELRLTSSLCGDTYDMADIGEDAYLTYSGVRLNKLDCSIKFENYHTYEKQTCIKAESIKLRCTTKVEIYRHFVSSLGPVKSFSCGDQTDYEWCGPTRTNRVHVVFRNSVQSPGGYIRLHIYLKKLPGKTDSYSYSSSTSSSSGAIIGAVVGAVVVLVIMIGSLIACKVAQQRRLAVPRTPYMVVQTTPAPGNVSSNQPLQQPVYQPPQQAQFQPGLQGYQLHPMQGAQPVSTGQGYNMGTAYHPHSQAETGRHSPANFHQPTAPPLEGNAEAPPSYESCTK